MWDDIWIEICRHVHYEGLPPTVAELTRYVQEWCENRYGKQPGDSTLKPSSGSSIRSCGGTNTDFSTVFAHFRLTTRDQLRKLTSSTACTSNAGSAVALLTPILHGQTHGGIAQGVQIPAGRGPSVNKSQAYRSSRPIPGTRGATTW